MANRRCFSALLRLSLCAGLAATWIHEARAWPGFEKLPGFNEQTRWTRLPGGVRVFADAPHELKSPRRVLVIYATPNGNTIEQTLGCAASKEMDYRFDIQHIAAQVRRWREVAPEDDVILTVVQAPKLSWPGFRAEHPESARIIRELVASLTTEFKADRVILAGHSGGGSFLLGYLNSVDSIPATIDRMILLDANYSYTDEQHGDKLLNWLRGDPARRLIVIAYDDREITLNGKKVIGPEGGTFRATQRMADRFRRDSELTAQDAGEFHHTSARAGQIQLFVHPNRENKILHTALVGEMNGLLHGLSLGTEHAGDWGRFGGPRAYGKWVQPTPFVEPIVPRAVLAPDVAEFRLNVPPRPADAPTGSQFQEQIAALPRRDREAAIVTAITSGNVPEFLRRLTAIRVDFVDNAGVKHVAAYFVTSDYLAVGTDQNLFRIPMTPHSAVLIADKFEASLITAKISDDMFAAAPIRLDPKPLTKDRDAVATFFQHHQIIEKQLRDKPRGLLVAGIKKDLVLSNRLKEKPHKVAIYGWHQPDGSPIQPLYVGHVDWYVDYSHGIRLMSNRIAIDGQPTTAADLLKHPSLHKLLSDEGPIDVVDVRRLAAW